MVKGVVYAMHSTLRRIVASPREADELDREFRLPLLYAQAGEPPGEVQLRYTSAGWPQVVLTHADGRQSEPPSPCGTRKGPRRWGTRGSSRASSPRGSAFGFWEPTQTGIYEVTSEDEWAWGGLKE